MPQTSHFLADLLNVLRDQGNQAILGVTTKTRDFPKKTASHFFTPATQKATRKPHGTRIEVCAWRKESESPDPKGK
jgi:hypothetical protein